MRHEFEKYCTEPEKIENYEKAKKDNFKGWNCHHRLETHNSDGERRLVDISQKELIALGMYYHRPASELIFLTTREHNAFRRGKPTWSKGKQFSEEYRKKISESHKGKKMSEEARRKMSESAKGNKYHLGKKHTNEAKKKMSEAWSYDKHFSDNTKKKLSEASKGNTNVRGRHWYHNGEINIMAKECPPGFVPGRLKGEQNHY